MTATLSPTWTEVAAAPFAAPLRAVHRWRSEPHGDGVHITALTTVEDADLVGHFPGFPVLPGVFVVEALAQAVALVLGSKLAVLRSVRFLAPYLPGDELRLDIDAEPAGPGGWTVTAQATRRDGARAATMRAAFGQSCVDAPAPAPPGVAGPAQQHRDVRCTLPQRHPLLLVDQVSTLEPGRRIVTVKAVTATEPAYRDLPDGSPLEVYAYPASLLIESLGQSAALLWLDGSHSAADAERLLLFVGARDYRFHAPAYPGEVLRHVVELESVVADTAMAVGQTWAGDRLVASVGSLMAARRPRGALVPR